MLPTTLAVIVLIEQGTFQIKKVEHIICFRLMEILNNSVSISLVEGPFKFSRFTRGSLQKKLIIKLPISVHVFKISLFSHRTTQMSSSKMKELHWSIERLETKIK